MGLQVAKPLEDLLEKEWDSQLFKQGKDPGVAPLLGWQLSYHTLRSKGSRAGFPDRVVVHESQRRIIFAELKREKKVATPLTAEQRRWLDALAKAGGEVYLWRPSDLDEIGHILAKRWEYDAGASSIGLRRVERLAFEAETETFWTPGSMWIPGRGRFDDDP